MSISFESANRIGSLIAAANAKTGESSEDLTAAVQVLMDGYKKADNVGTKDVTFIDYDGTVLYAYTIDEAKALTELPPLPSREGLICQGWNYDLSTIQSYDRPVTVGAMYTTDDGTTRIHIHLEEGRTAPMLGVCPLGTVEVDWGDGTPHDTLTGASPYTVVWTQNHQYAQPGDYVIRLTVTDEMGFYGRSSANESAAILRYSNGEDTRNYAYRLAVREINIGSGVTAIGQYAFARCEALTRISIPREVTEIDTYAFYYSFGFSCIVIPDGVTEIPNYMCQCCYNLAKISLPHGLVSIGKYAFGTCQDLPTVVIPNSVTSIGDYAFTACYNLRKIVVPDAVTMFGCGIHTFCYAMADVILLEGLTSVGEEMFSMCRGLSRIVFPASMTSIAVDAFEKCYGVRCFDFTACATVPELEDASAFDGIAGDCQLLVPAALYDEWIAADEWESLADYIVAT